MAAWLLSLLFLCGCEKYYVTVKREYIDGESLASVFVRSPDPRSEDPPEGELFAVEWNLPSKELSEPLTVSLELLYRDYESERISRPLKERRGLLIHEHIGQPHDERGSVLSYRAMIENAKGEKLYAWQEQLWVAAISLEEIDF